MNLFIATDLADYSFLAVYDIDASLRFGQTLTLQIVDGARLERGVLHVGDGHWRCEHDFLGFAPFGAAEIVNTINVVPSGCFTARSPGLAGMANVATAHIAMIKRSVNRFIFCDYCIQRLALKQAR